MKIRKEHSEQMLVIIRDFVWKCENGRARSTKTYSACRKLLNSLEVSGEPSTDIQKLKFPT